MARRRVAQRLWDAGALVEQPSSSFVTPVPSDAPVPQSTSRIPHAAAPAIQLHDANNRLLSKKQARTRSACLQLVQPVPSSSLSSHPQPVQATQSEPVASTPEPVAAASPPLQLFLRSHLHSRLLAFDADPQGSAAQLIACALQQLPESVRSLLATATVSLSWGTRRLLVSTPGLCGDALGLSDGSMLQLHVHAPHPLASGLQGGSSRCACTSGQQCAVCARPSAASTNAESSSSSSSSSSEDDEEDSEEDGEEEEEEYSPDEAEYAEPGVSFLPRGQRKRRKRDVADPSARNKSAKKKKQPKLQSSSSPSAAAVTSPRSSAAIQTRAGVKRPSSSVKSEPVAAAAPDTASPTAKKARVRFKQESKSALSAEPAAAAAAGAAAAAAAGAPASGAGGDDEDDELSSDDDDDDGLSFSARSSDAQFTLIETELLSLRNRVALLRSSAAGVDVSANIRMLDSMLAAMRGKQIVGFLGDTGVGKSFLINLMLFLTAEQSRYSRSTTRPLNYQLEARVDNDKETVARMLEFTFKSRSEKYVELHARVTKGAAPPGAPFHELNEHQAFESRVEGASRPDADLQFGSWLLPTGQVARATATTPFVVRIRFGRTFHMTAKYQTREELQQRAFVFWEQGGFAATTLHDTPHAEVRMAYDRWLALTGIPEERLPLRMRSASSKAAARAAAAASGGGGGGGGGEAKAPPLDLTRWQDVPLRSNIELQDRIGRVVLWYGNGACGQHHFEMDRCYLREALAGLMAPMHAHAIGELVLYVPCGIVANGCELHDIPGSNDATRRQVTDKAIRAVDVLILLTQKGLDHSASVATALLNSQFIDEVLISHERRSAQLHVLFCAETASSPARPSQLNDNQQLANYLEEAKVANAANSNWVTEQASRSANGAQTEADAEAEQNRIIDVLERRVHCYDLRPLAFSSLALNTVTRRNVFAHGDELSEARLRELMAITNMPRLLSAIYGLAVDNAVNTLDFLVETDTSRARLKEAESSADVKPSDVAAAAAAAAATSSAPVDSSESSDTDTEDEGDAAATASSPHLSCSSAASCSPLDHLMRELRLRLSHLSESQNEAHRAELARMARMWIGNCLTPTSKGRIPVILYNKLLEVGNRDYTRLRKEWQATLERGDRAAARSQMDSVIHRMQASVSGGRTRAAAAAASRQLADTVLSGTVAQLRQACRNLADTLLQPLEAEVVNSMRKLVLELCDDLFENAPEMQLRMVQETALSALDTLLVHPLQSLLMKGDRVSRIEGTVLSEFFRKTLREQLNQPEVSASSALRTSPAAAAAAAADVPAALDAAVDALLDEVIHRADKRMIQLATAMLYTQQGKPSAVRQIVTKVLRELAVPRSANGDEAAETRRELQSALSDLRRWHKSASTLLRRSVEYQSASSEQHAQQLLTAVFRRNVERELQQTILSAGRNLPKNKLQEILAVRAKQMRKVELSKRGRKSGSNDPFALKNAVRSTTHGRRLPADLKKLEQVVQLINKAQRDAYQPGHTGGLTRALQNSALAQALSNFQLHLRDVAADGNCLFSALAQQLKRVSNQAANNTFDDFTASQLRAMVMQQLLHWYTSTTEKQQEFLDAHGEDVLSYVTRMRETGQWGGYLELQAFADLFCVNVRVWFSNATTTLVVRADTLTGTALDIAPTIDIALVNAQHPNSSPNHYMSVE